MVIQARAPSSKLRIPAAAIFFGLFFHKLFTRLGIRLGLGLGLVILGVRDSFSILSLRCSSTAGRLVVSLGGRLPACYTRRLKNIRYVAALSDKLS